MNVVQVTPTTIYPPKRGGQNRAQGLVVSYPDHGDSVRRFVQGGLLSNHRLVHLQRRLEISDGLTEIRPLNPLYDLPSLPPALLDTPGVFSGPILRYFPSQQLRELLDWADLVQVEMPFQVAAVSALTADTPVVYSSHNVESVRWRSINGTDSFLDRWSYRRVRSAERQALTSASAVICTSDADRHAFDREYDVDTPAMVAPNGVFEREITDCGRTQATPIRREYGIQSEAFVGVFLGSSYEPNVRGLEALLAAMNDCHFERLHILVVGRVCEAIDNSDVPANCSLVGFVDDLEAYLCAADVGLNPITSGGGTNVKVLDYFAHGLPVISTSFGVRGFDFTTWSPVDVVEIDSFPDEMSELRGDPERYDTRRQHAKGFVRERTWERISSRLRAELVSALGIE